MQEIYDLFELEAVLESNDKDSAIPESVPEHLFLALSQDAQ